MTEQRRLPLFSGLDTTLRFSVGELHLVEAVFDFTPSAAGGGGGDKSNMLQLRAGDVVTVIDKAGDTQGWWKAYNGFRYVLVGRRKSWREVIHFMSLYVEWASYRRTLSVSGGLPAMAPVRRRTLPTAGVRRTRRRRRWTPRVSRGRSTRPRTILRSSSKSKRTRRRELHDGFSLSYFCSESNQRLSLGSQVARSCIHLL